MTKHLKSKLTLVALVFFMSRNQFLEQKGREIFEMQLLFPGRPIVFLFPCELLRVPLLLKEDETVPEFTAAGLQGPLQAGCRFGKLKVVPGTVEKRLPSPV